MATVDEIVKDIEASIPGDYGLAAAKWIDNRYKELVSRVRFRSLRTVGELSVPAPYITGTVAITKGSTAVVGTGTLWETEYGAATQEYLYLRASTAWHKVASVTDETNLVLTSAFAETTVTAATYHIVKRDLPLDSSARWVSSIWHDRRRRPLKMLPHDVLSKMAPDRILVSSDPIHWSQVGTDSSNNILIEIYPFPKNAELLHYVYWAIPSSLTLSSTIPAQIDAHVLKEGALIDTYRWKKAQALDAGKDTAAATWANLEARQKTSWESYVQQAIRTQLGVDDITLILRTGLQRYTSADIRNARDHWLITHERP